MNLSNFWLDVWSNVIANLLAGTITIFATIAIYIFYTALTKRQLLQFIGVTHKSPDLRIVCSRIEAQRSKGQIRVGTRGPAVSLLELHAAEILREQLTGKLAAILPKGFLEWLHGQLPTWTPLIPIVDAAPREADIEPFLSDSNRQLDELFTTNTILLGSSSYNSLVKVLEHRKLLVAKFDYDNDVRCFKYHDDVKLEPARKPLIDKNKEPIKDTDGVIMLTENSAEGAILQRMEIKGRIVIVCAGFSSNATRNAVEYFVRNWNRNLPQSGDFARYLVWFGLPQEEEDIRNPNEIKEINLEKW